MHNIVLLGDRLLVICVGYLVQINLHPEAVGKRGPINLGRVETGIIS